MEHFKNARIDPMAHNNCVIAGRFGLALRNMGVKIPFKMLLYGLSKEIINVYTSDN